MRGSETSVEDLPPLSMTVVRRLQSSCPKSTGTEGKGGIFIEMDFRDPSEWGPLSVSIG